MPPIVTFTVNPAVDKNSAVQQVVAERKLRCENPEYHPGGGGLNVARAITELGGEVTAYWTCGGAIGQLLEQLLDEEAVLHRPISIEAHTRENLIMYERSSELQYRFGMPGATLTADEVQKCRDRLHAIDPPPKYLVLSGSLPPGVDDDFYAQMAAAMPSTCRAVLDTSGGPLKRGLEAPLYLVKPNMRELGHLAGREVEDDRQIREVARSLIDRGEVQAVVTSLGPDRWPQTYDRTPLDPLPPCARRILTQPNDALLKPAGIRHVVRSLLALGWHPRHIAGLIRSKYERDISRRLDLSS